MEQERLPSTGGKAGAVDLAALRQNYGQAGLRRADLHPAPVEQFRRLFQQACDAQLLEPNAYGSRKASDIAQQPAVSLLFPWYGLQRQLAVLGQARRISLAESLAYFASRPFGSQLGTWVSQQSQVISSRSLLEQQWDNLRRRFSEGEVPLPESWGGYRVEPSELEFWQGRENRLHDRFRYRRSAEGSWQIERLVP